MAKLKKRNWHDRNYPPRGTAVSGLVKEMNLKPDEVVYIGGKTFSSGFHWIGRFKDVPEEYGNLPVVETYRRTVDYPGTILLSDALTKNGQYWNWNECDSTVKPAEILHQLEHSGAEQLLIAIARNEAHDYRDKLRSALRGNHDPDKVKNSLEKIIASSNHLLELIGNVLDMSRIESGRMVLEESWVSIREIVQEVTDLMKPEILTREHECELRVAGDVPDLVLCDKLRMTQLLLNILSNAVKYTPKQGRIRLSVSQKTGAPAGYSSLEFVVSDTGIGMSREFRKRIFEPFERENNSTVSKVMGSGLGMPICKGIVDSMGGSLTVDSRQGRGTVITVNLALRYKSEDSSGGSGE